MMHRTFSFAGRWSDAEARLLADFGEAANANAERVQEQQQEQEAPPVDAKNVNETATQQSEKEISKADASEARKTMLTNKYLTSFKLTAGKALENKDTPAAREIMQRVNLMMARDGVTDYKLQMSNRGPELVTTAAAPASAPNTSAPAPAAAPDPVAPSADPPAAPDEPAAAPADPAEQSKAALQEQWGQRVQQVMASSQNDPRNVRSMELAKVRMGHAAASGNERYANILRQRAEQNAQAPLRAAVDQVNKEMQAAGVPMRMQIKDGQVQFVDVPASAPAAAPQAAAPAAPAAAPATAPDPAAPSDPNKPAATPADPNAPKQEEPKTPEEKLKAAEEKMKTAKTPGEGIAALAEYVMAMVEQFQGALNGIENANSKTNKSAPQEAPRATLAKKVSESPDPPLTTLEGARDKAKQTMAGAEGGMKEKKPIMDAAQKNLDAAKAKKPADPKAVENAEATLKSAREEFGRSEKLYKDAEAEAAAAEQMITAINNTNTSIENGLKTIKVLQALVGEGQLLFDAAVMPSGEVGIRASGPGVPALRAELGMDASTDPSLIFTAPSLRAATEKVKASRRGTK